MKDIFRFGKWYIHICFLIGIMSSRAMAAHPLITDDTGTQGRGKFQLEVNGEYALDNDKGIMTNTYQAASALTYGLADTIDIILGVPYFFVRVKDDKGTSNEDGISDLSLEMKWRFYERDGLSFALKPGITLPSGDDEKGLGSGRVTYHVFLIATKEAKPWAFHLNLGYIRNENKVNERRDVWHASMAATVEVIKDLKLVGDVGVERNPDRHVNNHPAFIIGGVIYSLSECFDIDFGVKSGLNRPETDYSLLSGVTWRF
jgi:hypothetical protein